MNSLTTISCIVIVLEKQIVFYTKRFIHVRTVSVFAFYFLDILFVNWLLTLAVALLNNIDPLAVITVNYLCNHANAQSG